MITKNRITAAITAAVLGMGFDAADAASIASTVKVGKEAALHTGSKGCLGYFSLEDSLLSAIYYECGMWADFQERVNAALRESTGSRHVGLEPINSVEFSIWE